MLVKTVAAVTAMDVDAGPWRDVAAVVRLHRSACTNDLPDSGAVTILLLVFDGCVTFVRGTDGPGARGASSWRLSGVLKCTLKL